MAPLITWGLPTSRYDPLLFGGDTPWSADQYDAEASLSELRRRAAGADTDLNPLEQRDSLIDLTATHANRAEILRRYRLYSRQPDEMVTFRALQRMRPRALDFDPKLYQYGGAYIYLVGGVLAASHALGLVHLTGDLGFYLERPEQFARFYVVARVVSLAFGLLLLWAAYRLGRRAGGRGGGWFALVLVAAAPGFLTAALEAKPHLASTAMLAWAIVFALRYHDHGRRGDAWRTGLAGGLAMGLALTGAVVLALYPLLAFACWQARAPRPLRGPLLAAALAGLVYAVTNPYVVVNLLAGGPTLSSNLGNTAAMFSSGSLAAGAVATGMLLIEACGLGVVIVGLASTAYLTWRYPRELLLCLPSVLLLVVVCAAVADGKPAEFARFLLLPASLLCIAAAALLARLARRRVWLTLLLAALIGGSLKTTAYVRAFSTDGALINESRFTAGQQLVALPREATLAVIQEPAPFAIPPLDFTRRSVFLLTDNASNTLSHARLPEWLVLTADDLAQHADAPWHAHYELARQFAGARPDLARITWANKPVYLYHRRARP